MKSGPFLSLLFWTLLLTACSRDSANRNPYLPEFGFRYEVNMNLPQYSLLTSAGNPVYIGSTGVGIRGVFVMNIGFDQYMAFEASCPNHAPNSCSTLQLTGQTVHCDCEDYEYSLFTGQMLNRPDDGDRYYDLLYYRAVRSGNSVIVSN